MYTNGSTVCQSGKSGSKTASIAPYLRVNGIQPASEDELKKLEGLPSSASIAIGTVDDSGLGGRNADQVAVVTFAHLRQSDGVEWPAPNRRKRKPDNENSELTPGGGIEQASLKRD
jgi:hypothetical protein